MKKILFALCALLLVPTLALASGDMVSISELRQQVETMGGGQQAMRHTNGKLKWIFRLIYQKSMPFLLFR